MKKWFCLLMLLLIPLQARAEDMQVWQIVSEEGEVLTEICYEPEAGDCYITGDNRQYEIASVSGNQAVGVLRGTITLPDVTWAEEQDAMAVSALTNTRRIAMYCTHSDESYEPSDGYYTTRERGTIYQVASALAAALQEKGIDATASDVLHHPHDAGAYRRSRQTAVELLKTTFPDVLIDIHRDGIPDPASYAVSIGGKPASKIRLLVGRGNQNAELNKDFALRIKAVADSVYPGLIKDIYMGKGTFNQDLLPRSILLECGTYTLEKERVMTSMPMMADVLNRAVYGSVIGSVGRITSDASAQNETSGGITQGQPDTANEPESGAISGFGFLGIILLIVLVGFAILSAGSFKKGMRKAARNLSEMSGGLLGSKPKSDENPEHS